MKTIKELSKNRLYWLVTYDDTGATEDFLNWIPVKFNGKNLVDYCDNGLVWDEWLDFPEDIITDYEYSRKMGVENYIPKNKN